MQLALSAKLFSGVSQPQTWSQVLILENLGLAVEVSGPSARETGSKFLERVKGACHGQKLTSFKEVNLQLRFFKGENANIKYAFTLQNDTKLQVVVVGGGQVWLGRGGKTAALVKDHGSATGTLKVNDRLLLITAGLSHSLTAAEIKSVLNITTFEDGFKKLSDNLKNRNTPVSGSAVIFNAIVPPKKRLPQIKTDKLFDRGYKFLGRIHLFRTGIIQPVNRTRIFIVSVCILAIFGLIFGVRQTLFNRSRPEITAKLNESDHKLEEGTDLIDLNPLRARELLTEAKTLLETELKKDQDKSTSDKLQAELKKVNQGLQLALKSYEVPLAPYFELPLVKSGAKGSDMALYQDLLVILDVPNKSLYTLSLGTKAARIVAGGDTFTDSQKVAVHGEDIYVLAKDIKKVVTPVGNLADAVSADPEWGNLAQIVAYAGNLYVLDNRKNQIWKYIRTDTGFSAKQNYLLHDVVLDLSNVSGMVIDGSLWFVKQGEIMRFTQGEEIPWRIAGLDEGLGSDIQIYTDDTLGHLYILDEVKKRVVVVDKDGNYYSQYRWKEERKITKFVASEVLNRILLLSGDTIYGIDLK